MDFHLSRRGSNPDTMVNCNSTNGTGGIPATHGQPRGSSRTCASPLNIHICPTTGGLFRMDIPANESVQELKKLISKKLGISQDRISLLHKERLLKDGSLLENQILDGARITLLPNVESGIISSPPEVTVMQALENISDSQINDFLSGKSPLTLAMRLGNHMMFLQLQLSTAGPASKRGQGLVTPTPVRGAPFVQQRLDNGQSSNSLRIPPNMPTMTYPRPISPSSAMTPPPSPKSTSRPSVYQYPVTSSHVSFPSPSPMTSRDVILDPANTPPPSPCYVNKSIPNPPTILVNDKTVESGATIPSTDNNAAGRIRTSREWPPSEKENAERVAPLLDRPTLAEAKRSLSMKLKEFSKQTKTEKVKETTHSGAVIESMQKLGRGVYSGTFSGTLNPALQDPEGKPKKNVSTIIHILNDLLGATSSRPGLNGHPPDQPARDPTRTETTPTDQEHKMIRGKVEHLQMMMEERRRRRQARRHANTAPYRRQQAAKPDGATSECEMMDSESCDVPEADDSIKNGRNEEMVNMGMV